MSTGTACGQLIELVVAGSFPAGIKPAISPGPVKRVVGQAVTVRFLPFQQDARAARYQI